MYLHCLERLLKVYKFCSLINFHISMLTILVSLSLPASVTGFITFLDDLSRFCYSFVGCLFTSLECVVTHLAVHQTF